MISYSTKLDELVAGDTCCSVLGGGRGRVGESRLMLLTSCWLISRIIGVELVVLIATLV